MKRFLLCFAVCLAVIVFSGTYQTASAAEMDRGGRNARAQVAMKQTPAGRPRGGKTVANYGMTRREIKNMPITERPDRPGHPYGNAVRRRASM